MPKFAIFGSTFNIKEDLKAFGCAPIKGANGWEWHTKDITINGHAHRRLKGLVEAAGANMFELPEAVADGIEKGTLTL